MFVLFHCLHPALYLVIQTLLLLDAYHISSLPAMRGLEDWSRHGRVRCQALCHHGGMASNHLTTCCVNQCLQLISDVY